MTTDISTAFSILDQSSDTTSTASTTTETPQFHYAITPYPIQTLEINVIYDYDVQSNIIKMTGLLHNQHTMGMKKVSKEDFDMFLSCEKDILINSPKTIYINKHDKCKINLQVQEFGTISEVDSNTVQHVEAIYQNQAESFPGLSRTYAIALGRSEILAGSPIYKALNDPDGYIGDNVHVSIDYTNRAKKILSLIMPACSATKNSYSTCVRCLIDTSTCKPAYSFEDYAIFKELFSSVTQAKLKETQCVNSNDAKKILLSCSEKICPAAQSNVTIAPSIIPEIQSGASGIRNYFYPSALLFTIGSFFYL